MQTYIRTDIPPEKPTDTERQRGRKQAVRQADTQTESQTGRRTAIHRQTLKYLPVLYMYCPQLFR